MHYSHPLAPYAVASEAMLYVFLGLAIITVAVVATVWVFLWVAERISYWGASNRRSLQELRELQQEQDRAAPVKKKRTKGRRGVTARLSGNKVFLAELIFPHARNWLSFSAPGLVTDDPDKVEHWLDWLRKAEKGKQELLVAVIHNKLGCLLARDGDYKSALVHFDLAFDVFTTLSHELTEGQVSVQCLEQLEALGHAEAGTSLQRSKDFLLGTPYGRGRVGETILRNLSAARIRLTAPHAVELYFKAIESFREGDKSGAAMLFERAATAFEDDLGNTWYRWPVAAARHDQVIVDIFDTGYGADEHEVLLAARAMIEICEVPSDRLREMLRNTVELTGVSAA